MLARLQIAMNGIGLVVLVSLTRDSYALAGGIAALYALSNAAVGPQISRLIDARGQRRIVRLQLAVNVPAVVGLILVIQLSTLTWPAFPLAVVAGATQPIIGSLVRARWSTKLRGTDELRTAFAWESLVDEAIFIVGPPLATVLALSLFPSAALVTASVATVIGTWWLLSQRSTEPVPSGRTGGLRGRSALLLPGVGGLALVFVFLGGIFGSMEVVTVAFTAEAGQPGAAGLALALYAVGSLITGLIFGAARIAMPIARQFLLWTILLAVVTAPMPFLPSVVLVGAGLFLAGSACSPALILGMSLVDRIVPPERLTEAISWTGSGLAVGIALSSPLAGVLVDADGSAGIGYVVTAGCAVAAALTALALHRTLTRAVRGGDEVVLATSGGPAADRSAG
ncbi:MFS transporter [Nakamurella flavida]